MSKFKIGDRVRRINTASSGVGVGAVGKIIGFNESEHPLLDIGNQGNMHGHFDENLELVETPLSDPFQGFDSVGAVTWKELYLQMAQMTGLRPDNIIIDEVTTNMTDNSIQNKLNSLALSADDRLLRKFGVEDECGNPTGTGLDLAQRKAYAKYKKEIIADLEKIEASEKKEETK